VLGRPLTRTDLRTDNPYNTYRIDGLPPGPISNPGEASLAAVMWALYSAGIGLFTAQWLGHQPLLAINPELAVARIRSLALRRPAGATADGAVVQEDPLPALATAVADHGGPDGVQDVVVVTYPHVVADTLRRDWASRAREHLQVPVLHLYAGTSRLGD
jgi:hypothetical protein